MNPDFYKNRIQFAYKPFSDSYRMLMHADEIIGLGVSLDEKHKIELDFESCESEKPRLVYGTILEGVSSRETDNYDREKIIRDLTYTANGLKDVCLWCFKDLDEENRKLTASVYKDIVLFEPVELKLYHSVGIPFAAYLQSRETISEDTATVFFPNLNTPDTEHQIFSSFANRPIIICCEHAVPFPEGTTLENWKETVEKGVALAQPERLYYTRDVPEYKDEFWEMLNSMASLMSGENLSEKKFSNIINGMLDLAEVTDEEAADGADEFMQTNPYFASVLKKRAKGQKTGKRPKSKAEEKEALHSTIDEVISILNGLTIYPQDAIYAALGKIANQKDDDSLTNAIIDYAATILAFSPRHIASFKRLIRKYGERWKVENKYNLLDIFIDDLYCPEREMIVTNVGADKEKIALALASIALKEPDFENVLFDSVIHHIQNGKDNTEVLKRFLDRLSIAMNKKPDWEFVVTKKK